MINLAAQALGVEPSRLRELAEADKDGRVIILPCKVYETDGVRVYEHTVREVIYEYRRSASPAASGQNNGSCS